MRDDRRRVGERPSSSHVRGSRGRTKARIEMSYRVGESHRVDGIECDVRSVPTMGYGDNDGMSGSRTDAFPK